MVQTFAKPPWKDRKRAYLEHIGHSNPSVLRVALADKLDNVRSILADYRQVGESLWSRFNAGKEDQLWFFRALVNAFRFAGATGFLMEEFERTVGDLEVLTRVA